MAPVTFILVSLLWTSSHVHGVLTTDTSECRPYVLFQGAASFDRSTDLGAMCSATEWALLDDAVATSMSLSSPSPHNRQLALRLINYHTLRYCQYTNKGCTAQMPTAPGTNSTTPVTTTPQPPVTNGTSAAWANVTGYGKTWNVSTVVGFFNMTWNTTRGGGSSSSNTTNTMRPSPTNNTANIVTNTTNTTTSTNGDNDTVEPPVAIVCPEWARTVSGDCNMRGSPTGSSSATAPVATAETVTGGIAAPTTASESESTPMAMPGARNVRRRALTTKSAMTYHAAHFTANEAHRVDAALHHVAPQLSPTCYKLVTSRRTLDCL